MDRDRLSSLLETRWLGRSLELHARLASTNTEAMERAAAGAPHGAAVLADEQTAGRGRQGRPWHSPPGANLYLSAVLRPKIRPAEAPTLSLAAAVGLAAGLTPFLPQPPLLKWPNDLLVRDRKLSGVLVEMSASATRVNHVVLGLGVNVNLHQLPAELAELATSLRLEAGAPVDREEVCASVLNHLEPWIERLVECGPAPILAAWEERSGWLGRRVTVSRPDASFSGVALGLDPSGALRLRLDDGTEKVVVAGDVADGG